MKIKKKIKRQIQDQKEKDKLAQIHLNKSNYGVRYWSIWYDKKFIISSKKKMELLMQ